jgi:monoterpene epsilon-lactone hydrolase
MAIAAPSIQEMREGFEQMAGTFPVDPSVRFEPTNSGGRDSEWASAPGIDPSYSILYLHGGGYVVGSINTGRAFAARLSKATDARVLTIDYRLAPEHPFPAAVEDAVSAYRWMLEQKISAAKIALTGDSAGGGLVLAALVAIRDATLPMPAAGICLSPWVDLEGLGASMTAKASVDPMLRKAELLEIAKLYLNGQDPHAPLAAPLYADLSGLPPLLIQVGTAETLLDDSIRIAERARKAGVEVKVDIWENMIHVFQMFAHVLDEGRQAIDQIGEFIKEKTLKDCAV